MEVEYICWLSVCHMVSLHSYNYQLLYMLKVRVTINIVITTSTYINSLSKCGTPQCICEFMGISAYLGLIHCDFVGGQLLVSFFEGSELIIC